MTTRQQKRQAERREKKGQAPRPDLQQATIPKEITSQQRAHARSAVALLQALALGRESAR